MRHFIAWLFLPVFAAVACTHTLQTDPTRPETLPALQRRLAGKDLRVIRTDGTEIRVPNARVTAEGVGDIPWGEIRAAEHRDHGWGALEGLGIGAGVGLTAAIMVGVAWTISCSKSDFTPTAFVVSFCSEKWERNFIAGFVVGSIVLGPPITVLGLLLGAIKGSKTRVVVGP